MLGDWGRPGPGAGHVEAWGNVVFGVSHTEHEEPAGDAGLELVKGRKGQLQPPKGIVKANGPERDEKSSAACSYGRLAHCLQDTVSVTPRPGHLVSSYTKQGVFRLITSKPPLMVPDGRIPLLCSL